MLHLGEVAAELSCRLCRIFLRDKDGHRPVLGHSPVEQNDPNFRDNVLFYEFFHGDTGRGLGAAHQTGWTALIALAALLRVGWNGSDRGDGVGAPRSGAAACRVTGRVRMTG